MGSGATVLDAREKESFNQGHIPAAQPVDWRTWRDGITRVGRLQVDLEGIAHDLSVLGVQDDAPVLVYGAGSGGWGEEGRIFWMLEYLGHADAHILDGGWAAWDQAGLPASTHQASSAQGDFQAHPKEELRTRLEEMERVVESCLADGPPPTTCKTVIWDTREKREFDGATPYLEHQGGHIPSATHLWFGDLFAADGTLLSATALQHKLSKQNITPDKHVVALCTGGVRSGMAYAVLRSLGYQHVTNYDGSMWEWTESTDRAMTPQ